MCTTFVGTAGELLNRGVTLVWSTAEAASVRGVHSVIALVLHGYRTHMVLTFEVCNPIAQQQGEQSACRAALQVTT